MLRDTHVARGGFCRLGSRVGWDDLAGSNCCFPTSPVPTPCFLHLLAPSTGISPAWTEPRALLSAQGRAGGTETKDSKRRGVGQVRLLLGAPKALQRRRTFLRREGVNPPRVMFPVVLGPAGCWRCWCQQQGGGLGISRRDQNLIRNQTEWMIRFEGAGLGNVCEPPGPP